MTINIINFTTLSSQLLLGKDTGELSIKPENRNRLSESFKGLKSHPELKEKRMTPSQLFEVILNYTLQTIRQRPIQFWFSDSAR